MSPTRELAMQIEQEAFKYTTACNLPSAAIYGGVSRSEQLYKMRAGVEILVATPGRLLDFLEYNQTNLRRCTYLVLDEADRMLDMGFEKDMIKIIEKITCRDR
jgi:ATP-dependent RNA helicase DDX5/DBP2